ncbi:amino acid ABC transporter permease [Hathewaya histolytica]|uniref:amino acid ABC transporter permease n=1 Tax=Hathewaya histolytica TaxID=1498 RepID=UPI003B67DF6C
MNFDINFAMKLFPLMLRQLHKTIYMSFMALLLGIVIAILITIVLESENKVLKPIIRVYISFFRGTPLIAQLFLLHFGVIQLFPYMSNIDAIYAAILGLGLNASAYMSESMRGAIESVDKGQYEACYSLGMGYLQTMKRVVLPQAIRVAIPSLSNSFIDIIKGSSIAFALGVNEIMATAQMEGAASYKFFEAFTDVIIIYWILISILSFLQKKLENTIKIENR